MDDFLYNLRKSVEERSKSGNRQRGGDRRCGMDRRDRKPQKHHHDRRSYNPFNRSLNEIKQLLEKLLAHQAHQQRVDDERLKLDTRRTEAMERIADYLGQAAGLKGPVGGGAAHPHQAPVIPGDPADEAAVSTERSSAAALMTSMRAAGKSYEKIAQVLEEKGISTVSGRGRWRGQTVKRELAKLGVHG